MVLDGISIDAAAAGTQALRLLVLFQNRGSHFSAGFFLLPGKRFVILPISIGTV